MSGRVAVLVAAVTLVAGCADDGTGPVASAPIRVVVTGITAADVRANERIEKDVAVTASGAAWPGFIDLARAECGGAPAGLEVIAAGVELLESSATTDLSDAIGDLVDLYFDAGGAGRVIAAGSALEGETTRLPLPVMATRRELAPILTQLLAGDFRVGLSAEPDTEPPTGFSMDVALDFQVRALCE